MKEFWSPIEVTLKVSILAGIVVFIAGVLLAKVMADRKFKGKIIVETILMLPLVLPPTVVGLLLIAAFGKNGLLGRFVELIFKQSLLFSWEGAVAASAVVAFPLMYQTAKAGLLSVEREIIEASLLDGADKWKAFLKVELPLCSKSLLSGFILSFTRALGEFGATLMVAGNIPGKTQTLSMAVYVAYEAGERTKMWGWVLVSVLISFLFLVVISRIR